MAVVETDEWILRLVDQASGSAAAMSGGLKALDAAQLKTASSALALANAQRAAAVAAAKASADPGNAAKAADARAAAASAAIQAAQLQAKMQADAAKAAGAAQEEAAAKAQSAMQAVAHPIDAATSALSKMGPEGMAAAAAIAVLTAAVTATIGTMTAMAAKAIEMTERARALRESFAGLAGGAAAGKALQASIAGLNLPFASSEVNKWAATLTAAGVKGRQLEAEMRAIAAAQALGGPLGETWGAGAEEFFKKMGAGGNEANELLKKIQAGGTRGAEALKAMGLNVEDFGGQAKLAKMSAEQLTAAAAAALQVKGGGALAALGNTWDVIKMKAMGGLFSILSGLTAAKGPVETFMGAVRDLFSEFNKGGVLANTLRPIVTVVFTKLFEWGTKALQAIHKGFLMVMIAGLTAYIALRPLLTFIADFVGSANMLRGVAIVFALMAVPWVLLAAAVLTVVTLFGIVVGVIVAVGAALVYVVGAIAGFVASIGSAFADAYAAATGAGGSIVDGLVAGVMAGAGAFMDAISGLASKGLAAFKGIFGIASPAKVMIEHGDKNIAGGLAMGVDKGADKVDASMERLGGGAKPGAKGGDREGGRSAPTVLFDRCTFGEGTSEGMIRDVVQMMWLELEREAAT